MSFSSLYAVKGQIASFTSYVKDKFIQKQGLPKAASTNYAFMQYTGHPEWMKRDYSQFADEAYRRNVIAHRAIHMIASGAASIGWRLHKQEKEMQHEIKNHPLLTLLKKPNPACEGGSFFESIYAYRLLSGNAYILAVENENHPPQELYALRPDRMDIVEGDYHLPKMYRYKVKQKNWNFPVNPLTGMSSILHLKQFHPLDDWYGLSSVEPASYAIDQHNHASEWNQALLQNGARPSGAIIVKTHPDGTGGLLSNDQYDRLKEQMHSEYQGAQNAGKPLLLEGGLDWKEMSLSPKDMDFIASKHSNARDIALAFGVPPQLLGIPGDNTYSNLAEARLALWEQTILPLAQSVISSLNHWLVPRFDSDLVLSYHKDKISALTPRRESVWARIQSAEFMTINEKREAVGLSPLKDESCNQLASFSHQKHKE